MADILAKRREKAEPVKGTVTEQIGQAKKWAEEEKRKADLPGYGAAYRVKVERELKQKIATIEGKPAFVAGISRAEAERRDAEWKAKHTELATGEWVDKAEFELMPKETQDKLRELGIEGYNRYVKEETAKFEAGNIKLDTGEYVPKKNYDALSTEDQDRLKTEGVEKFNEYQKQTLDAFKKENIQLGTGEWIKKEDFRELPTPWQGELRNRGVEAFGTWIKTAYGGAKEYIIVDGKVYGTTQSIPNYPYMHDPNIALDSGGNRIWVGGRWPDSVTGASMGVDVLSGRWPEEVSTFQPITPLTHVQVGPGIGAESEWVAKAEFKAIGEESKAGQEILKKKGIGAYLEWGQKEVEKKVRAEALVARREIAEIEARIAKGELVELKTGDLIFKDDWDVLLPKEQEKAQIEGREAIYVDLPDGQAIAKKEFEGLDEKYQKALSAGGFEAYDKLLKTDNVQMLTGEWADRKQFESLPPKMQQMAITKGLDAIDTSKLTPKQRFEKYKEWGVVEKDDKFAGVDESGQMLIEGKVEPVPWHKKYLTKEFATGAGIGMIPIAGTVYHWKTMSPWMRAGSIALDIATFIPIVSGVSIGVRAGKGVMASVGRVALAEAKAPITLLTRPVATTKAMIRPLKTLISPKRVPVAAAEIKSYILKIPSGVVDDIGDVKSAMKARDTITEAAMRGAPPVVEVGGKEIKLAKVALQQKGEIALVHNSPDVRWALNGTVVREGGEGLGLFIEPYLNTRLIDADAFGRGFTPSPDIGIFEWKGRHIRKIGKYAPSEIAALDIPPIRGLNLADAKNIPDNLAPALRNYMARENGTVVGSFSEWLKVRAAKRPGDIDLNFANPVKAKNDIANIARQAGHKTRISGTAVEIRHKGKWVEVCDVKGLDTRKAFYTGHGMDMMPARTIDGIRVIPLGEQYLRQGFGALEAGEDIAKYKKRTEHMFRTSKELRELIQDVGLTERMRGAIIVRDTKIATRLQPSNKLYRGTAEIESTIKPLTELDPPSQVLQMYDATGETIHVLVIGKPFTATQIANMKIMGAVDTIRDIFRPAMKIDGKAVKAMDEINELAVEARALKQRIELAREAGKLDEVVKLQAELGRINSRTRAIGRTVDTARAARTSLRPIVISTGDFIDRISYRDAAARRPVEFARTLKALPRAERERIVNELDRPTRVKIEREIARVQPAELPRVRGLETPREARVARVPRVPEEPRIPRVPRKPEVPRIPRVPRVPEEPRIPRVPRKPEVPRIPRVPRVPRVPEEPRIPRVPRVKITKFEDLTAEEKLGAVAWKQGFYYWLIYPPYQEGNVLGSHEPFRGVKIHKGPKSAYKSLVRLGKKVPEEMHFDLGAFDIRFVTRSGEGDPRMYYTQDPKGKTKVTGRVRYAKKRKVRRVPRTRRVSVVGVATSR